MEDRPIVPIFKYAIVYAFLMLLWGLNMGLSYVHLGRRYYFNNAVSVAIACTQALLVFLFFMHVRYHRQKLVWFFASAGLFWLGILMVLTMSDYLTRNHPAGVNPKGEPVFLKSREQTGPAIGAVPKSHPHSP